MIIKNMPPKNGNNSDGTCEDWGIKLDIKEKKIPNGKNMINPRIKNIRKEYNATEPMSIFLS
jgi:hypothetical protein